MTSRPYLDLGATDLDLGSAESETISMTRSLINLSDLAGETKNVLLASILSGEKRITVSGTKVFTSDGDKDTWVQTADAIVQGGLFTSVNYYSKLVTTPYSGQAYYTIVPNSLELRMEDGTDPNVIKYTLEMIEGKGVAEA